jgi:hypothetical protein
MCRQCDALSNCNLTLCGPYLPAELADPNFLAEIERAVADSEGPGGPADPSSDLLAVPPDQVSNSTGNQLKIKRI